METSEIKPASRRARVWARLADPDQWPRRWWYPPSSRRDVVLQMSEVDQQDYRQVVQQAHEKFSETVRLTMFSLLGLALFCLLITFSVPDSSLLVADPAIKMPFADVQVSFQNFVFLAPVLLSAVTVYLHIFYGAWLDLDMRHRHFTLSRESGEPPIARLPTLFSIDHPVPRLLTACIFYWLVPLVLVAMTWKAAARVEWGIPLIFITSLVTAMLVFLQIRRRPAAQRQRMTQRLHWGGLVLVVLIAGYIAVLMFKVMMHSSSEPTHTGDVLVAVPRRLAGENVQSRRNAPNDQFAERPALGVIPQWLQRPLNLFRVDLKGKWLAQVNLQGANADLANFEGAILPGANFQGAKLRDATLRSTDLQGANFRDANLLGANLHLTKLWDANFQDANLQGANFQGADLQGADFQGTKVPGAKLQGADFQGANLRGTDFRGAWIPGAKFLGAKLHGANFQDANFRGVKLRGVDLRGIKNLTEKQLQLADTDEHTLLPDYLKKPVP